MIDTESLHHLLNYLPPAVFHQFLSDKFKLNLPVLNGNTLPQEQQKTFYLILNSLDVSARRQIEDVAENILQLSDCASQNIMDGYVRDHVDASHYRKYGECPDQYQRALWLCTHEPDLFHEVLNTRQADIFRQTAICYSGFSVPKNLPVSLDENSRVAFRLAIASYLECDVSDVAIRLFTRSQRDDATTANAEYFQISVHYNCRPILLDWVDKGNVASQKIIRSETLHIIYEPSKGHVEVLCKSGAHRDILARLFIKKLLHRENSDHLISVKYYDYQSLASPRALDISGENIAHAKVVELGYSDIANRTFLIKITHEDSHDIYTIAKSLINPTFNFQRYRLNYAKLAIRLLKAGKTPERTLSIVLRGNNECNIKSKNNNDRALCDRLLKKWQLVKDSDNIETASQDIRFT